MRQFAIVLSISSLLITTAMSAVDPVNAGEKSTFTIRLTGSIGHRQVTTVFTERDGEAGGELNGALTSSYFHLRFRPKEHKEGYFLGPELTAFPITATGISMAGNKPSMGNVDYVFPSAIAAENLSLRTLDRQNGPSSMRVIYTITRLGDRKARMTGRVTGSLKSDFPARVEISGEFNLILADLRE
jgi:hypothetical protein